MLVPTGGGSPVYETLRIAAPDQWDPQVKNFVEFGKAREGKTISSRKAGTIEWKARGLEEIKNLDLKPEYRTANWPEDDEEQVDARMTEALAYVSRYASASAVAGLWTRLAWQEAPDAYVQRMWRRHGAALTAAFQGAVGVNHFADEIHAPVIRRGQLEVGIKRAFDEILPPTEAGWQRFLEMAATTPARFDALERAGAYWWGRTVPRDVHAGATEEQKALRAALEKARVEQEREEAARTAREEYDRREREAKEREEQQARWAREREEREAQERAARAQENASRDAREAEMLAKDPYATTVVESPLTREPEVRGQLKGLGGYAKKDNRTGNWVWIVPLRRIADVRRILRQV
jgi:hypothetical protein